MIEITPQLYAAVAAALREAIGTSEWFNGCVELQTEDIPWSLTLTAIIYRRDEIRPEGPRRPIDDVVPVWWEFSTMGADGVSAPNDFSFGDLKPYLKDYD